MLAAYLHREHSLVDSAGGGFRAEQINVNPCGIFLSERNFMFFLNYQRLKNRHINMKLRKRKISVVSYWHADVEIGCLVNVLDTVLRRKLKSCHLSLRYKFFSIFYYQAVPGSHRVKLENFFTASYSHLLLWQYSRFFTLLRISHRPCKWLVCSVSRRLCLPRPLPSYSVSTCFRLLPHKIVILWPFSTLGEFTLIFSVILRTAESLFCEDCWNIFWSVSTGRWILAKSQGLIPVLMMEPRYVLFLEQ